MAKLTKRTSGYSRDLGWKLNRNGKRAQHRFLLGKDQKQAELASLRLEQLWQVVVDEHKQRHHGLHGNYPPPNGKLDPGPLWTDEALALAEAIRKGQLVIDTAPHHPRVGDAGYATHLAVMNDRFGHIIAFRPADPEAVERGKERHAHMAQHRIRQAENNAAIAGVPIPSTVTATLYQALTDYAERAEKRNAKESSRVEARNARRLKDSTPDMDLSTFGYTAMEQIRDYWTARPEAKLRGGKGTGRPISLTTVDNHLSTARRFVRWLDRSDTYRWELPRHGLDALKVNLKRLRTDAELSRQRNGVQVFTLEQLAIIWKHATDFERLLVLLAINAAMAQAEIMTLRWDEVDDDPPTIKRIRRKSGVYAEFVLWPETVKALAWWKRVRTIKGDLVMMTDQGRPYTRQRISNQWSALRGRIERTTGEAPTWWLPFKHLGRKTGGQLVRNASDGEITGVYLSHGQPVATDELADVYTNRPFHKVADALEKVRYELAPMFRAAPDAFQSKHVGRGPRRRKAG